MSDESLKLRACLAALLLLAPLLGGAAAWAGAAASPGGSWVGTYTLVGQDDVAIELGGGHARVALGAGHAGLQTVPADAVGGRVRFSLPGVPAPVVFDLRPDGASLTGTVRQGGVRGEARLARGTAPELVARGVYRIGGRTLGVVDDPYGPERLVDLRSGEVRALTARGSGFAVGSGFARASPAVRTIRLDAAHATRVPLRQLEVRFRGDAGATLAGTLTLPPGDGPHAAVAWVTGSGPTTRAYLPDLVALLVANGVAVLAYDKRGTGQSTGGFPGESPTAETIDVLARDAAAAVRFLARQPGVDRRRVGLAGHSQAGWIVPLAASREPAIRFLVLFSGPAVSADENDLYQTLAGEGNVPPSKTEAEIDAEVERAGRGGVDPVPWIRKLAIPSLWLYGGLDHIVPPRLSAQRLAPFAHVTVATFPRGNHALVETRTGLTSEMLRSHTFAPGLFARVAAWLREHGLA